MPTALKIRRPIDFAKSESLTSNEPAQYPMNLCSIRKVCSMMSGGHGDECGLNPALYSTDKHVLRNLTRLGSQHVPG